MDRNPRQTPSIDASFTPEGLKRAVRGGTLATLLAQIASQLVSVAQLAFLYRLIAPADFGLLGMVLPLVLFLRLFTTLGLNVATVGRAEISPAQVSALFWWNLALGVVTTAVTALLAPLLVWFYALRGSLPTGDDQTLLWLTIALGGTALVSAVSAQHQALLERRLQLARVNGLRLAGQLAGAVTGAGAALAGAGVWALVAQQYVELLVLGAIAWVVEPWRPSRPNRNTPVRELMQFGGHYTASSIVFFLSTNVDKVLVGSVLGPVALGYYSQAFNLAMKPVLAVTSTVNSVMLPALGLAAHDAKTFRQLVAAFFRLVAILLLPVGVGVAIVAPEALAVLGGPAWAPTGMTLRILAALIVAQGFINITGSVFAATGRADRLLMASLLLLTVVVQGVAAGWFFAAEFAEELNVDAVLMIAAGYAGAILVVLLPFLWYCLTTVGMGLGDWWQTIRRPLLATMSMGLVVVALRRVLVTSFALPIPLLLALEVAAGVGVYVLLARGELKWLASQLRRE